MVIYAVEQDRHPGATRGFRVAIDILLGMIALCYLAMGLYVWLSLVGFLSEPALRFDELDGIGRAIAAGQSILLPVVAVGLWSGSAWGRTVWFLAVAAQMTMFFTAPERLPFAMEIVLFHLVSLVTYLLLLLAAAIIAKRM